MGKTIQVQAFDLESKHSETRSRAQSDVSIRDVIDYGESLELHVYLVFILRPSARTKAVAVQPQQNSI